MTWPSAANFETGPSLSDDAACAIRRERWTTVALIALTVIAMALRFGAVDGRVGASPPQFSPEEASFIARAADLRAGVFFHDPARPPGYPLFIAAVFGFLGANSAAGLLYVQAVLGAAMVPLTYLLALQFIQRRTAAVIAAGLVAIDVALVAQARLAYTEILHTPVLLCALLAWVHASRRGTRMSWALAGLFMGWATIIRPVTLLLPLVVFLAWPKAWPRQLKWRATFVYVVAMFVVILPFTINNLRVHKRFLPVSLSGAVLWQGSPEFYERMNAGVDIWRTDLNPAANGGHDPFTIDGESYFNRRALGSIVSHPLIYAWYSVQKGWYFWFGNPNSDGSYFSPPKHDANGHELSVPGAVSHVLWRQLPWVALVGLIATIAARRKWLSQLRPAVVLIVYMTLAYALTYAGMRYSSPLHPVLIVLVVVACEALLRPELLIEPAPTPGSPGVGPTPQPAPRKTPGDPAFDPILDAMVGRRRN